MDVDQLDGLIPARGLDGFRLDFDVLTLDGCLPDSNALRLPGRSVHLFHGGSVDSTRIEKQVNPILSGRSSGKTAVS